MKMSKMSKEQFLSYIKDDRKEEILRKRPMEVLYFNPVDSKGNPSSFVFIVLHELGKNKTNVYCGGSKYNAFDTKKTRRIIPVDVPEKQRAKYKPTVTVSGFSLEEGLKQACNRAWREMMDMPSLYGKGHANKKSVPTVNRLMIAMRKIISSSVAFPSPFAPRPVVRKQLSHSALNLLNAKLEDKHATKKSAHS